MLRWKQDGRNHKVTAEDLARLDQERFKAVGTGSGTSRPALFTFCQRSPGAVTAHFLAQVRQRLLSPGGRPRQTKEFRSATCVDWVDNVSGLCELRSQREAYTLTSILDTANKDCIAEALDILVMRLHALQVAKAKGGTWEKASQIELIGASTASLLPAGLSS